MNTRLLGALVALTTAVMACPAVAATYRCEINGTLYISDRPCAAAPAKAPGGLGAIGPARQPATYLSRAPGTPSAPEHLRFLSQPCAQLNDAIRTAPARGVSSSNIGELRREYQQKCSEDEQYARQQLSDAQRQERDAVNRQRKEAERSQQEVARLQQRCVALRDALRSQRAGADEAARRVAMDAYNNDCLGK